MAEWEQATRDRIKSKAKEDAKDSPDRWRDLTLGFDALGLPDSGRARYGILFALSHQQ